MLEGTPYSGKNKINIKIENTLGKIKKKLYLIMSRTEITK